MRLNIKEYWVPVFVICALVVSAALYFVFGQQSAAHIVLGVTVVIGAAPLLLKMAKAMLKGNFGVDLVAMVAIVTSFVLGQYLAGSVVLLMLSGGEALEDYALNRAKRELTNLLSRAPSIAHLKTAAGLKDVAAQHVSAGETIVVKPGEVIPVDAVVTEGVTEVDESSITGEAQPVEKGPSSIVSSGTTNGSSVFTGRALRAASGSRYEQIVKLVREAQESKAPFVRLADRYAVWFNLLTFALAGLAYFLSHDWIRVLSVLVVATPCPLILATPIAVMSGVSRAASRGIIVKNGGALEALGEATTFLFDKTGTLTLGTPKVLGATGSLSEAELLRLAASLDQLSAHHFARALVRFVKTEQKVDISYPENFSEDLGFGVTGTVEGKEYLFGKLSYLRTRGVRLPADIAKTHDQEQEAGTIPVYLSTNTELLGTVRFADVVRSDTSNVFAELKAIGITKTVMLTGDRHSVAERVAREIGVSEFESELSPEQKVNRVKQLQAEGGHVVMVGDGVNDAPALAAADVGLAMAAHGATAASDAGDIVITVNSLQRVSEAAVIAKRTFGIARQSIFVGIGLSAVAMVFASLGHIQPVFGALLQEAIDVAVIFNALRARLK